MPRVDRVSPVTGWPGSLVEIDGDGFGPAPDDNRVSVGGVPALVVHADAQRLRVVLGEGTQTGLVEVVVSGSAPALGPEPFEMAEWPDLRDARTVGPPLLFSGPQHSTPKIRTTDMKVLVILAYGKGDAPANPFAAGFAQSESTERAGRYWREVSYGRSTFRFSYTPWLELPSDRHAYVWDGTDVDWAREAYLSATKRHAVAVGGTLWAVHQGLLLADVDIHDPGTPVERSTLAGVGVPAHVAMRGTTAYIAAGAGGLFVVDTAAAGGPVVRHHLSPPGRLMGCDISGDLLAVAALEGGLHLYDIGGPGPPVLRSTFPFAPGQWATTVRLSPDRAYVGAGSSVVVVDTSVPAVPAPLGAVPAGAWVMGLDVAGTTCVAATDGNGLMVLDVGPGGPTLRSRHLDLLRLNAVALSAGTAYVAAGAAGLLVVDVTDPDAPVALSTVTTARACLAVTVTGNRGWLGVGGKVIQPVDVTDPRAVGLGAEVVLTGTFVFGTDPDVAALRANLDNADDSAGLAKGDRLELAAIRAAAATSSNFDPARFEGILVVINEATGRAQSRTPSQLSVDGDTLRFPEAKGLVWLPGDAAWGRRAHEMGHWFGMRDIYEDQLSDGTFRRGTAAQWDLAGLHDQGPLFSGREALRMRLYQDDNVLTRRWTPSAEPFHEDFELAAHDGSEDPLLDRHHLLELVLAEKSLSYFVEVRRQGPPGLLFDQQLPIPAGQSRVVVTRVTYENSTINNSTDQPTSLFGVLDIDGQLVDAARLMRIQVLSRVSDNPPAYRIRVTWNEEPDPDPNGKFDLLITPWSTDTWETPDIWVNSRRNDRGATLVYEQHDPSDDTRPVLNGDRPWVRRENTVFARVTNAGPADAHDVSVSFSTTSPPGIGDNGDWVTRDTQLVPVIAGNSSVELQYAWEPDLDAHTCLQIAIFPQQGERVIKNDKAQENVSSFDSRGASSHEPVVLHAQVRSPFSVGRKVDLRVAGLPAGWHAVVEPAWVWLPPHGTAPARAIIWTDLHSPRASPLLFDGTVREAFPRVEGWTDFDHLYVPIGGVLAPVRANARGEIAWELSAEGNRVHVLVHVNPVHEGIPVSVEVTDERGGVSHFGGQTTPSGDVEMDFVLPDGRYSAQAFSASTPDVAETEGVLRTIDLPH